MDLLTHTPLRQEHPHLLVGAQTSFAEGWWIYKLEQVDSTSNVASQFPEWHAIRARVQTAGRGRTGHAWVSNIGGLWLSAVLPCPAEESCWRYLPLAVGWSLLRALRRLGAWDARLRWPNDLLIDRRKLAGIIVDRYNPETVVVGVGLNVFNRPESTDPRLAGLTTRLSEVIPQTGTLDELTLWMLRVIREAYQQLKLQGFSAMAADLNRTWTKPRKVQLQLANENNPLVGDFLGIDAKGQIRLRTDDQPLHLFDATQVALLTELE